MAATTLPRQVEEIRKLPLEPLISKLVEVPPEATLPRIIALLSERGTYEVFLPEAERCGMIAARDVLKTTNFETTKPSVVLVYVPTLARSATIGEGARLMADYRIRAIPITDGKKVIGQVNSWSVLKQLQGKIGDELRVTSLATKNLITVERDSPIARARELMVRKRIDHLPAMKQGRVEGILTSTHILSCFSPLERVGRKSVKPETRKLEFNVSDAMETSPLTCSAETSTSKALDLMLNSEQSYILITQWEELQAIATHRDFMTILAQPEPEADLPVFLVGLPDDPFEAEATKVKFKRTVNQLHRIFPDILEARSVIKTKFTKPGKERGRYEVTVHIRTSRRTFSYSEGGYELPAVYDIITDRLKRLLTQKQGRHRMRERERAEAS